MKTCLLPGGGQIPVLGLGTWRLGEASSRRAQEVGAVRSAIAMGYRLIDTAEMYADGAAESLIGKAIADAIRAGDVRREDLCIVSKVYPHNASRKGTVAACERSLARLGLDHLDLYLLHWRSQHPLRETCEAMQALVAAGRIARWGVSNFDVEDMQQLFAAQQSLGAGAANANCATNQVYYSLRARGVEYRLLPWQRERGLPLMAYSPIDQGALAQQPLLHELGRRRGASAAQMALAWVLRQPGISAIPKAVREDHLRENLAALDIALTADDLAQLEREFPAPRRKTPLAML
jgi:diketogulonate reductase-like aldo/keto reductase